jgi:hypothetical protein
LRCRHPVSPPTMVIDHKNQVEKVVKRRHLINRSLIVKRVVEDNNNNNTDSTTKNTTESKAQGSEDPRDTVNQQQESRPQQSSRRFEGNLKISPDSSLPNNDSQITYDDSKNEGRECAICIMSFEVGDDVCWSRNPECDHAFHIACLKPWLLEHIECPCCRNNYLLLKPQEASRTFKKKSHQQQRDVENQNER